MNKLPLNLVIFTSSSPHYGHENVYKTTIEHYKAKLGSLEVFQNVYAHVKVKPKESHKLSDILEYLYENDIHPLVTEGDWERGMSHQTEYLKDIYKTFSNKVIQSAPFTFWVEDDSPIHLGDNVKLYDCLMGAISTLLDNQDILNIRFQRDNIGTITQPVSEYFNIVETFDFQPNISRSRDLYLAIRIIFNNWAQLQYNQCEASFRMAMNNFSNMPFRFLCFSPKIATSYHLGAPNYLDYLKLDDFKGLKI